MKQNKRNIGFLTYDLQPFTVECLTRIAARLPDRLKAYPVFERVDPPGPLFAYRPSGIRGRFFAVRREGFTPEGLTSSINWGGAWACVWENDVVVLFGIQGGSALVVTVLASVMRRSLVSVNQTLPPEWEARRRWWILWLKQWILRRCRVHIVQTPVTALAMEQVYKIPKEQLVFAPFDGGVGHFQTELNRVVASRETLRQAFQWRAEDVVFLFVGTLLRFKGIDTLMEAVGLMQAQGEKGVRVVCFGPVAAQSGEMSLEEYRQMARDMGVERWFDFPGSCSLGKLAEAYLAADVCVLPTRKDTWGKVLAEAALAGLPLITTEACGAAHALVVEGESGFVVPPGDGDALAVVMDKLLDQGVRIRLGQRAREVCQQWCSGDQEVMGYLQALERV